MWKSFNVNIQNIKADTGRAVLITMPNSSSYKGYCFWHPAKLVRGGRHSYSQRISYTENFTFKLIKYGQGKYNKKEIVSSKEIGYKELEEAFEVMDQNIVSSNNEESYLIIEEPKKVSLDVEVKKELKNE